MASFLNFTKMHGAGNDYVYVSGFDQTLPLDLPQLAIQVSDRRFGIEQQRRTRVRSPCRQNGQ